ncbi:MAG: hypothetical protein AB7O28_22460 [Vicinamibacterales bacterium]
MHGTDQMGTCDRPAAHDAPLAGPPPGWRSSGDDPGLLVAWGELSADQADGFAPDLDECAESGLDEAHGYGHGV